MNQEEQAIFGNYQKAVQRRQLESDSLKLEPRYRFLSEMEESELDYWMGVFGEVKAPKLEPESDEPFYTAPEKCYDEPETQVQQAELERYGYYYKSKA